ncbi:MAG: 1-deoxy-D-xylulose-5-phosphate synthase [Prevotellaceae bacterium]|jgi:1-deoxy-D-xylulose-5-phosphate synthase|nr:1-deoxy-D-xylulose-5-phosphate synthase [Prevotellaceae bacterium]
MPETQISLLQQVNLPADLKKLKTAQLPQLCAELRDFIIAELAHNPGHLGASLGVVELTVAVHYVFDTPYDRVVWDVGHQAYAHKILTGRREQFHTNRQLGGLCGFPTPKESEYDAFGVGHASTSISAALGMSIAAKMNNENRNVVAIIGDGSLTGGLAFEGLNNASTIDNNLLIIVNDNQMAIDPIKGGWSKALGKLHTSKAYNRVRYKIYQFLFRKKIITETGTKKIIRFFNVLKSIRKNNSNNIFEGLSIRYFGPCDGHNVVELVEILQELKNHKKPRVLHCITQKGKGYLPAEEKVTLWHAPGKFDAATGEIICNNDKNQPPLFQDVFGKTLVELAKINEKIVGITPAMPTGCSMNFLFKEFPKRAFDVGIAEGHAVTFSAGLAKEGFLPFCNIYSSFMQRAYDNVIHDVALQNLPVIFCIDRAGIVGSDGATHQGQFDLAYFRCIPNLTICAPKNEHDLRNMMFSAQSKNRGAWVIRYPRGNGFLVDWHNDFQEIEIGKGVCEKQGKDLAILSLGTRFYEAQKAAQMLENELNISVALYDMKFLKPLDEEILKFVGENFKNVVTIEDGVIKGGFGSAVLEFFAANKLNANVLQIGIPDRFIEHGTPNELYKILGMDNEGIEKKIRDFLN